MITTKSHRGNGALAPSKKHIDQPDLAADSIGENPAYEALLVRRYPCLGKPSPEPWNSDIAPTYEEQLAKVIQPRPMRPLSPREVKCIIAAIQTHRQELRLALLELLAEDIGIIVGTILEQQRRRHGKTTPASV